MKMFDSRSNTLDRFKSEELESDRAYKGVVRQARSKYCTLNLEAIASNVSKEREMRVAILSALLVAVPTLVSATDLKDLQERCEAYGAKRGTPEFFTCMRELDRERLKKEVYRKAIEEECRSVSSLDLIVRGIAKNDEPWDAANGFHRGVAMAQEQRARCQAAAARGTDDE